MVAPVIGGILRHEWTFTQQLQLDIVRTWPSYYDKAVGSVQAKPFTIPSAYTRQISSGKYAGTNGIFWSPDGVKAFFPANLLGALDKYRDLARNAAYEKLKNQVYDSAQIGASLGEIDQSFKMIATRGKQLLTAARALKRGDIVSALTAFDLRPPKGSRFRNTKSFGNLWLEYHFGWEPLVKDIYDATMITCLPVKPFPWKGKSKQRFQWTEFPQAGNTNKWNKYAGTVSSEMSVQVDVTNPNIAFAGQLGFLNPLSIAWELVPFSFVVDWFANVSQKLDGMSDYAGMRLIDPMHTDFYKYHVEKWDWQKVGNGGYYGNVNVDVIYLDRNTGLISPVLVAKPFRFPSLTRAATAIGVLSQFLGDQRPSRPKWMR